MRWAGLVAVLVVTLIAQTTVARAADLPVLETDLLLVLALLYGLLAATVEARLAAWIIGFAADVMTEGAIGLHALAFGLTGLLLTWLRHIVNRQVWWGRLLMCFAAALPGQLLIVAHLHFLQGAQLGSWWDMVSSALRVALSAALFATLLTLIPPLTPRHRLSRSIAGRK